MASSGRIFVRGLSSEDYGLKDFRQRQLAAKRVRQADGHDHGSIVEKDESKGWSLDLAADGIRLWDHIEPGDDPFLTQTLQAYFHTIPPNSSNKGHGHQNEAAFYILEGAGYEVHDGERYDWEKGDLVIVHNDSVHRHFNPYDEPTTHLIVKAKPMFMFLGLLQQGRAYNPMSHDEDRFSERIEWGQLWTEGASKRKKIIGKDDAHWEDTPLGRVRVLSSAQRTDVRLFSVDAMEIDIPAGSHSGKSWKMADEVLHVVEGSGYSLHWEVEAEIDDKYYARIAKEPTRHDFVKGDTLYVPQNTVTQHYANDGERLLLFSGQNRMFKYLGYDSVIYLEAAPEFEPAKADLGLGVRR